MENIKEGKWFDFCIDGIEGSIGLKIRPYDMNLNIALNEKHAVSCKKKTYKVKGINWDNLIPEYIDHTLEDFSGIEGPEDNKPLEVNLENKKKVFNLPLTCRGQSIADFIFEKAAELAGFPKGSYPAASESKLISQMNKRRKKHG
jgi:hypothetical protein